MRTDRKPSLCAKIDVLMLARTLGVLFAFVAVISSADAETPLSGDAQSPALQTKMITPQCPGPLCQAPEGHDPLAVGLRVVYLNFEGVTLTASNQADDGPTNTSAIITATTAPGSTRTIPPFSPAQLSSTGGLSRDQIIARVVDRLFASHAAFDVQFTTTRPATGPYSMVVVGGDCQTVAGVNCAGVALLDCGDQLPSNVSFVFPPGLRVDDLATTAAQEAAHAFGLAHTNDQGDIMYPTILQSVPSGFGAGNIPSGDSSCQGGGFQDSYNLMLTTIGPRGQDTVPPAVAIGSPQAGAVVFAGDTVSASVTDFGEVTEVSLVIGGETIAIAGSPPFSFIVPDTTAKGEVILAVRALDDAGNMGSESISVYVAGPDDIACDSGACPDDLVCISDICIDRSGGGLGSFCSSGTECDSGVCATLDDEQRCSTSCDAATPCPAGFECIDDTACWPRSGSDNPFIGLCATGGRGAGSAALLVLIALIGLRRRRVAR